MFSKYSISVILKGQLKTMRPYGKETYDWREIYVFFGLPIIFTIIQYAVGDGLSNTVIGIVVSAASIFAGLLLNLLVLLYTILGKAEPIEHTQSVDDANERELIIQTFYNISYAILICALLIVGSLCALMKSGWWIRIFEFFVFFCGAQLFFLVAQILKRFHRLLEHKISQRPTSSSGEDAAIWGAKCPGTMKSDSKR